MKVSNYAVLTVLASGSLASTLHAEGSETKAFLIESGINEISNEGRVSVPAMDILKLAAATKKDGLGVQLLGPNARDNTLIDIKLINRKELKDIRSLTLPSDEFNLDPSKSVADWFDNTVSATCCFIGT